jgi:hypothetical protein
VAAATLGKARRTTRAVPNAAAGPLRRDANRVTAAVRDAWRQLIRAIPGGKGMTRPAHLARRLGVSEKLGWQVWRAARAGSPAELLAHLPGAAGVAIALDAAARAGAPRAAVTRARISMADVDRLVRGHAGDRASLAMMLAPAGAGHAAAFPHERGRRRPGSDEEHRRLAFLGTSYLWGVQARAYLSLSILHPGRADDRVDIASIRGVIDLRRLRDDLPWIITRTGCRTGSGPGHPDGRHREPLTARSTDAERAPVIEEFCSSPMPQVRAIPVPGKELLDVEVGPTAVGDAGSVNCMVGELLHNLPRYRTTSTARGQIAPILFTPCQRWIQDVLVHRGAEIAEPVTVSFYGDPRGEGVDHAIERNRLPIHATVDRLGRGPDVLDTPAIPRYRDLVLRAHELAGWAPSDDFVAYRVELTYPPTPSMMVLEFGLPDAPR